MATTVTLKPNAIDLSGSTSGTTTLQATAVAGTTTITLPAATDTLVGKATTDTLTNKTLTSPTITGGALNGTLGATTPSTVAATTISASGTTTLSGNQIISVTDNSNAALRITQLGTGNALLVEDSSNPDSSPFVIDASGNVGIGTSSPVTKLNIVDALSGGQLLVATNQTDITEKYGTLGAQHYTNAEEPALGMAVQSNATDNNILIGGALSEFNAATQVRFYTAANNTTVTGSERMRIDSSGRVLVGLTSANTSGANFQVSSGVTFPATQSASSDANTLDDYEEGTWTPTIGGTATYYTQAGRYVKIGRIVVVHFQCEINVRGTGSTTIMTGLPFNPISAPTMAGSVGYFGNLAANTYFLGFYANSSGQVQFIGQQALDGTNEQPLAVFGNGTNIVGSLTYET